VRELRTKLAATYPSTSFAFLPADMIGQILNFGLPSPIDVQIVGFNEPGNRAFANQLLAEAALRRRRGGFAHSSIRGLSAVLCRRGPHQGAAARHHRAIGGQQSVGVLVGQLPNGAVVLGRSEERHQYQVATQTPQYRLENLNDLGNTPLGISVGAAAPGSSQILSSLVSIRRGVAPAVVTHYNATPSIDIFGSVQGTDLGYVSAQMTKIIAAAAKKDLPKGSSIVLRGQVHTMTASFNGLLIGLIGAIVLVYMLIVVNFQSLLDPFIIITALPAALAGIVWMLFLTHTTVSVPALTGAIMCMGVATANSVLVISFARERMNAGDNAFEAALQAGFHASAAGADDGPGHDHRHDPDGLGLGRRRRAECALGTRRHRRPDLRHGRHAVLRAHRIFDHSWAQLAAAPLHSAETPMLSNRRGAGCESVEADSPLFPHSAGSRADTRRLGRGQPRPGPRAH
jgi:hypothetical protein